MTGELGIATFITGLDDDSPFFTIIHFCLTCGQAVAALRVDARTVDVADLVAAAAVRDGEEASLHVQQHEREINASVRN